MEDNFLNAAKAQFIYYKMLGDKTFEQLDDASIFVQQSSDSNSIAVIVKHMYGNMLSRWTDFLTSDGEKPWRERDGEFENDLNSRQEVLLQWEKGWNCLFSALDALSSSDLSKIVLIRNEQHTVTEAILRQLAHYPYHVGQIVHIGKTLSQKPWVSLSIPKGESVSYNATKFTDSNNMSSED